MYHARMTRRLDTTLGPTAAGKGSDSSTSEAIVEAAARCFTRLGISGTRVEDIAVEVGIARPNLYRYFASKDAILHAVVLHEMGRIHVRLAERFPLEGPAADIIIGWLVSAIHDAAPETTALARQDSARLTARELASSPEVLALVQAHWEPLLRYARQRGELRPHLPVRASARWLLFLQFSYLSLPELTPSRDELEAELRAFVLPALVIDEAP
jgi:AcrR family transcriptional regulator